MYLNNAIISFALEAQISSSFTKSRLAIPYRYCMIKDCSAWLYLNHRDLSTLKLSFGIPSFLLTSWY